MIIRPIILEHVHTFNILFKFLQWCTCFLWNSVYLRAGHEGGIWVFVTEGHQTCPEGLPQLLLVPTAQWWILGSNTDADVSGYGVEYSYMCQIFEAASLQWMLMWRFMIHLIDLLK